MSIVATEQELKKEVEYQGYKVLLHGFADRIDEVNGNIRIIDYKTGKMDNDDVKISKNADGIMSMTEKSIQLLMYKYLYLHNHPEVAPELIQPGIIGFQKLSQKVFHLIIDTEHELNKSFETTCTQYFNDFLAEIFDKSTPFQQTDDLKSCKQCDFKNICKRSPKHFN